jgi:hypothetical protein
MFCKARVMAHSFTTFSVFTNPPLASNTCSRYKPCGRLPNQSVLVLLASATVCPNKKVPPPEAGGLFLFTENLTYGFTLFPALTTTAAVPGLYAIKLGLFKSRPNPLIAPLKVMPACKVKIGVDGLLSNELLIGNTRSDK